METLRISHVKQSEIVYNHRDMPQGQVPGHTLGYEEEEEAKMARSLLAGASQWC